MVSKNYVLIVITAQNKVGIIENKKKSHKIEKK